MIGQDILRPLRLRPFATPSMYLLTALLRRIRIGRLQLEFSDGTRHNFGDTDMPAATLRVNHPTALLRKIALRGSVGFAESYIDSDWDSSDLGALLRLLACNERALESALSFNPGFLADRVRHARRANSKRGSRRNIRAHYDLGNSFYRLWLDQTMTYSAALFSDPERAGFADLAQAQQRKYDRLLDQLDAKPGEHILEIGCGWGGFALAAARRGLRVTGITLSREQLGYARELVREQGLQDRIELRLQDYRDLTGSFDHIVSIEMLEAVGEDYWETYFATLQRCVRPGGRIALQVITINESRFDHYRVTPDFIQLHVFPGGMLPTPTLLQQLSTTAGLAWRDCARFGRHYARTCALWDSQCQSQRKAILALGYDERFLRRWHYYLNYCQSGFDIGAVDLVHVLLERPA